MNKFKQRLREQRNFKGLTQEELADALKLKRYTIGDWEQGRTEPDIDSILMLANFFETSTDYLLGMID